MRAGRPTRHIRAKWITWTQDSKQDFYELDKTGAVIRENGKVCVHHTDVLTEKDIPAAVVNVSSVTKVDIPEATQDPGFDFDLLQGATSEISWDPFESDIW